jgi:AraC-like DNA-binding protein
VPVFEKHYSALQRIGPLSKLPQLMADLGYDIENVLEGLDVTLDNLSSPDNYISFRQAISVLDRCAEVSSIPNFGLYLGSTTGIEALGIAGRLMQTAQTLRDALIIFLGIQPGYSSGASFFLTRFADDWLLAYSVHVPLDKSSHQIYDLVLAIAYNTLRDLTPVAAKPVEVLLCVSAPIDRTPHNKFFKAPIRFDQLHSGLVFTKEALDTRLLTADAKENEDLMRRLQSMQLLPESNSAKIRHILPPLLFVDRGTMKDVAETLGTTSITLRRRLAREGTSFASLRDEVRQAIALELLRLTSMPVHEVAASLSFAHHSTFTRAFRRWTGKSPAEIRASGGIAMIPHFTL